MALGDPREQFAGQDPRQNLRMGVSQSGGGVVRATPFTDTYNDNSIPEFLGRLVEPYIKRKQDEAFYNGYMAQQAAGAEVEAIDDGGPISKIWGPDGYREGAAFYRGNALVTKQVRSYLEDVDNLKRLPPEELSKKFAEDSQKLLTGNDWTDAIVQKQMMEQMGPAINTVLKARFEWQQEQGVEAQVEAIAGQAGLMQKLYVDQARTTEPSQELTQAIVQGEEQFLGTLPIPYGQTSSSYKKALGLASRRMLREGNFYAFEAMKGRGLLDLMDEKDAAAIEKAYVSEGGRAIEQARFQLLPQILALKEDVKFERISPNAAAARYHALNEAARKLTGVRDVELFDAKAIEGGATDVIELTRQTALRNQARLDAIADREANWAHEERMVREKAAAEAAVAQTVWASGDINDALIKKQVEPWQMDAVAHEAVKAGRSEDLARVFVTSRGWHSSKVAEQLQSGVTTSLTEGWTDETARTFDTWKKLYDVNGGAAATYFGDQYHTALSHMDDMIQTGMNPALAWTRAFGNVTAYDQSMLRQEDRKEARAAVKDELKRIDGGFLGIGNAELSDSAEVVISRTIEGYVAVNRKYGSASVSSLAKQGYDKAIATGRLEHYGRFAWNNPKGTQPLWQATGIQADAFGKVFNSEVDERFKAIGVGRLREYDIARQGSQVFIAGIDGDGETKLITFTVKDLERRKEQMIRNKVLKGFTAPTDWGVIPRGNK